MSSSTPTPSLSSPPSSELLNALALVNADPFIRVGMVKALGDACRADSESSCAAILSMVAFSPSELNHAIHDACVHGAGCLEQLIKAGATPTQDNLSEACEYANPKALAVLLGAGLKGSQTEDLTSACSSGRVEAGKCVELLLKAGASSTSAIAMEQACDSTQGGPCVEAMLNGGFPARRPKLLYMALSAHNFEGALAFVKAGCPTDYNMLLMAIRAQEVELVSAMVLGGADVGLTAPDAGLIGVAAMCSGEKRHEVLKALFDAHAKLRPEKKFEVARESAALKALEVFLKSSKSFFISEDPENPSPSMLCLRELIKRARLDTPDKKAKLTKMTVGVYEAIESNSTRLDLVLELYNQGVDKGAVDERGRCVAHYAVKRNGDLDALKKLASVKAPLLSPDNEGLTPLHFAVFTGSSGVAKVVRWLVAKGADPDAKAKNGLTPLVGMARAGNYEGAVAMIGAGAKLTAAFAKEIRNKKRDQGNRAELWGALAGLCEATAQKTALESVTRRSKESAATAPAARKRLSL